MVSAAAVLKGLRVLDFTQVAAGPTCTMMLGDMGADVIKVESPAGELGRVLGPPFLNGECVAYLSVNRNKRSIVIDLKKPGSVTAVRRIARRCDVVVESFRPGVADRLGIGYETLSGENPRLVYCSISAYGQTGPWSERPGVDAIVQAESGLVSTLGAEGEPPCKVQAPVSDMVSGFLAAMAVLAALRARDSNGVGQRVDVSLLGSALMLQQLTLAAYLASGELPQRIGTSAPYSTPNEALPTKDGWIMVAAYHTERWLALCKLIGRQDLLDDPRFSDPTIRVQNRRELIAELSEIFVQKTTDEWYATLSEADILCGPIATYEQVVQSPQVRHRKLILEMEHPVAGKFSAPGFGIDFSASPTQVRLPPPMLGEHTLEVLRAFDFDRQEIAALCESGAAIQWKAPTAAAPRDRG